MFFVCLLACLLVHLLACWFLSFFLSGVCLCTCLRPWQCSPAPGTPGSSISRLDGRKVCVGFTSTARCQSSRSRSRGSKRKSSEASDFSFLRQPAHKLCRIDCCPVAFGLRADVELESFTAARVIFRAMSPRTQGSQAAEHVRL